MSLEINPISSAHKAEKSSVQIEGVRKRKSPAYLEDFYTPVRLKKTKKDSNSEEILSVFASLGVEYSADVRVDAAYRERISELWEQQEMPDLENPESRRIIRCIEKMKDDASDVYAQSLVIKEVLFRTKEGTEVKEKGVFATTPISKNQVIGVYAGELLPLSSLQGEKAYEYLFEFPDTAFAKWAIDGRKVGNFTRFMNHCPPKRENVSSVEFFYGGCPRVIFVASKNIQVGDELLYDYGKTYWENAGIDPNE